MGDGGQDGFGMKGVNEKGMVNEGGERLEWLKADFSFSSGVEIFVFNYLNLLLLMSRKEGGRSCFSMIRGFFFQMVMKCFFFFPFCVTSFEKRKLFMIIVERQLTFLAWEVGLDGEKQ